MRTLTLGVLIVAGGTLASLPFRRYQSIPDASADPVHVTGPTQSALAAPPSTLALDQPQVQPGLESLPAQDLASNLPQWQPQPQTAAATAPRPIDVPLTFDDLMAPIDQPVPIQQRYGATVPIREQQLEAERVAGIVMPALESLAASEVKELEQGLAQMQPQPEPVVTQPSRLPPNRSSRASASLASSRDEPLPGGNQPAETRARHWIRQPN